MPHAFLLAALALAPALSGCTLTFTLGSALRSTAVQRQRDREVDPRTLHPGETVRLDRYGDTPLVASWDRLERQRAPLQSPGDSIVHVLVYHGQTLRVPDQQVARLRRWPRLPPIGLWTFAGLCIDAAIVGYVAYSFAHSCAFQGCGE